MWSAYFSVIRWVNSPGPDNPLGMGCGGFSAVVTADIDPVIEQTFPAHQPKTTLALEIRGE
jgi:hypothetical protein